ncbi:hypothetical protein R84B8_03016 [Treponema sp. R8-4-B8]
MELKIVFVPSAFKHKVKKEDIFRAFETFIYEDPIDDIGYKYLLLGFNRHGNLIEVMYNKISVDTIKVFHAMPCRKAFREMIE